MRFQRFIYGITVLTLIVLLISDASRATTDTCEPPRSMLPVGTQLYALNYPLRSPIEPTTEEICIQIVAEQDGIELILTPDNLLFYRPAQSKQMEPQEQTEASSSSWAVRNQASPSNIFQPEIAEPSPVLPQSSSMTHLVFGVGLRTDIVATDAQGISAPTVSSISPFALSAQVIPAKVNGFAQIRYVFIPSTEGLQLNHHMLSLIGGYHIHIRDIAKTQLAMSPTYELQGALTSQTASRRLITKSMLRLPFSVHQFSQNRLSKLDFLIGPSLSLEHPNVARQYEDAVAAGTIQPLRQDIRAGDGFTSTSTAPVLSSRNLLLAPGIYTQLSLTKYLEQTSLIKAIGFSFELMHSWQPGPGLRGELAFADASDTRFIAEITTLYTFE